MRNDNARNNFLNFRLLSSPADRTDILSSPCDGSGHIVNWSRFYRLLGLAANNRFTGSAWVNNDVSALWPFGRINIKIQIWGVVSLINDWSMFKWNSRVYGWKSALMLSGLGPRRRAPLLRSLSDKERLRFTRRVVDVRERFKFALKRDGLYGRDSTENSLSWWWRLVFDYRAFQRILDDHWLNAEAGRRWGSDLRDVEPRMLPLPRGASLELNIPRGQISF